LRCDNATREETVAIFNDAVEHLNELGLLGGLSVEEAQKLVNVDYKKTRFSNDSEENFDCKIVGRGVVSFYDERDVLFENIIVFLIPF